MVSCRRYVSRRTFLESCRGRQRPRLGRKPNVGVHGDGGASEGRLPPRADHRGERLAVFRLANGDTIEVFAGHDHYHQHFTTGPVVGFRVDDVAAAQAEMEAAGIEFFGKPESAPDGYSWSHFRAPDGNVYELMSGPENAA
jgi:catechol 2,3-dioxygenase-like lactoylglutathione lyase family enzyme